MKDLFIELLFYELNKKNILCFDDIKLFQNKIKDVFVKENSVVYFEWFKDNYNNLEYFYNLLQDDKEKQLYLKMIVSNLIGNIYVTDQEKEKYVHSRDIFDSCIIDNSVKRLQSVTRKLKFYDLSNFGFDLKIYGARALLDKLILRNQYSYKDCKVEKDDYVIDAGGCWGDTSLIFAAKTGKNGKVFTFEFFEDNLSILKDNFDYNKNFSDRIILIEKPLYKKSDELLYLNHACADITTLTEKENNSFRYKTVSIDDFIEKNKIEKIDFIKMDIEGCELFALEGAQNTIKKHRPKLAIAAYHNYNDCYKISKFLNDLNVGYKFYFATYTLNFTDTVIYAK